MTSECPTLLLGSVTKLLLLASLLSLKASWLLQMKLLQDMPMLELKKYNPLVKRRIPAGKLEQS